MAVSISNVLSGLCKVFYLYLEAIYRLFVPGPPRRIRGKKVLITGAAGGIGNALSREFYKQGCTLVLWDLDKEKLDAVAKSIQTIEKTVFTYVCDITKKEQVKDVAQKVMSEVGEIDILVNNAGILIGGEFLELTEDVIRKTFEVNIFSHFTTLKEFLPSMIKRNSGSIVSIASMAGVAGTPCLAEYCASKHAVVGLHDSLSLELRRYGKHGITTHVVCPLFINTPLITGDEVSKRLEWHAGREGAIQPESVGVAVVEGVQRNRRRIFVPRHAGLYRLLDVIFPDEVKDYLVKNTPKLGFWSKSTKSTYN